MSNDANVFQTITHAYNRLTRAEKKIADYIFANRLDVQYMSITYLAEVCQVADATVFRFCRSIGFKGYNEFKLALAKSSVTLPSGMARPADYELYGKVKPEDSLSDLYKKLYNTNVEALAQTMELMDDQAVTRAVDLLTAADKVYCFGQGGSQVIAEEAWARFITVSSHFFTAADAHQQIILSSLLGERDVILYFSYSGATRDIMDLLQSVRERNVKVILATHFEKCPAAAYADVILLCGSNEGPLQSGSVAAKIALMYVIDVLYHEYCRRDMNAFIQNNGLTAQVIATKLL